VINQDERRQAIAVFREIIRREYRDHEIRALPQRREVEEMILWSGGKNPRKSNDVIGGFLLAYLDAMGPEEAAEYLLSFRGYLTQQAFAFLAGKVLVPRLGGTLKELAQAVLGTPPRDRCKNPEKIANARHYIRQHRAASDREVARATNSTAPTIAKYRRSGVLKERQV